MSRREFLNLTRLGITSLLLNSLNGRNTDSESSLNVITQIETEFPYFALTIDDGFVVESIEEMLDVMKENSYKATFFMIGRYSIRAERESPGIMKRISREGHEIGYHTMTHERPEGGWTVEWLSGDYDSWMNHHRDILGNELFAKSVRLYARPPWGAFTIPFMRMCENKGLIPFGWSNDPGSFNRGISIERGNTVLLHARKEDVGYLSEFYSHAAEEGLRTLSLGQLIWVNHQFRKHRSYENVV